ncbi:MAG: MMPL family transporter [Acidobacteriota bacterium]
MPTTSLLRRLGVFARHRYWQIFAVTAVLVVASVYLTSRLRFDTDVLNLLPKNDPVIDIFLETLDSFGSIDYLPVAVRLPERAMLDPYETFVDELAMELKELEEIESVEYHLGDTESLLEEFYPKAVLFLDEDGRARLAEKLSDEGIRKRVQEMRRLLGTPQGQTLKELMLVDPFGLVELFLDRVQGSRGALSVDWSSGYYLSQDHRMLLILAKPVRPPADVDFDELLVAAVEERIAAVQSRWPEMVGVDPEAPAELAADLPPPPEVALGGGYLTALDDARFIRRDAIVGGLTSLAGVLLLFLFAFRRLGPLLFAVAPLACGLILTFGFSELTLGKLSSATSMTAALLIGLGIDFVIVSYGRYVEERRRGGDLASSLAAMAGSSGRAVVVGGLTTAATFYAFLVTDFTGLRQMGFLTGTGILLCMLSVLFLLPALLAWRDDRHRRKSSAPNLYMHSFGLQPLMRACVRSPRVVVAIGVATTAAAAWLAAGLGFEESMQAMRPEGNRGIQVTKEVGERFGSGFDYMMLVLHGDTPEEVLALAAEAAEGAKELVDEGVLNGYGGVGSLIPPPARQAAVLDWLDRKRGDALDIDRIAETFRAEAAAQGLRSDPFEPGIALLGSGLSHSEPIGIRDFADSAQGQALLDRFVQRRGDRPEDGWVSLVYLYPPENLWRREPPPPAVALADELGPQATLTGTAVINERVRSRVRPDAWLAGILGLLAVGVLLYFDFRSLRYTLLSLLPLTVGICWMLGIMALLGIDLNFMNIFVTTMIIGIGVDYGLHMVHRFREGSSPSEVETGMTETGNAIVVAALSTVCGFGSLVFSHYPGLRSVGFVAVLGAISTALVAVTLLPAVLTWVKRRSA